MAEITWQHFEAVEMRAGTIVEVMARQIGPMKSEFLLAGFYRDDGAVVLAVPERPVQNGARLG